MQAIIWVKIGKKGPFYRNFGNCPKNEDLDQPETDCEKKIGPGKIDLIRPIIHADKKIL